VLGDGAVALGPVGLGDGTDVLGTDVLGSGVLGSDVLGSDVLGSGVLGSVVLGSVVLGDEVADQGGAGAVGVADGCAEGNQPGIALGFSRVGSWVGVPVAASGVDPKGLPTGSLLVAPADGLALCDSVVLCDSVGVAIGATESFPPNGTTRSRPTRASAVAARAPSFRTGGPPYRPIGPRTG
jgi:hypothetical protein